MATMKTNPVSIPLYGHGVETVGNIDHEPHVKGTFAAATVTGEDGKEYALFTVADEYPAAPSIWAGTYRISVERLRHMAPSVFVEV